MKGLLLFSPFINFLFQLTTPPVNTKALAILSSVAGEALIKHLEKILPAMIRAVNDSTGSPQEEQVGKLYMPEIRQVMDFRQEKVIYTTIKSHEQAKFLSIMHNSSTQTFHFRHKEICYWHLW